MVLEINGWMVNHFKRIPHVFLVLDARKCWMENLFWKKFHPIPSNIIFFFFYEMLDEIGAFKLIQHFVQHRKCHMLDEMLDTFRSALKKLGEASKIEKFKICSAQCICDSII